MLAMALESVGLPVEGIGLVMGVNRIFDMVRTTVNIIGDAACAVIVSKMEERNEQRTQGCIHYRWADTEVRPYKSYRDPP